MKYRRILPDGRERIFRQLSGPKFGFLQKGAGIYLTGWGQAAGQLAGAAHVQAEGTPFLC